MREIKFRGYTGRTLGFIEDIDIGYDFSGELSKPERFDQYTGLKDKNGVEIYEGDIVVQSDDEPREVKFANGEWVLNNHLSLFYYEINTLEVIGNIYENKELL